MASSPGPGEPLATRAAASVGWLTVQSWVVKVGGFVTVTILARLLTPTDFGLVAIAMTIVPIIYLIADLGFGTYLLQAPEVDRKMASTAFWYSTVSATVLAGLLAVMAPLLEDLFNVPGVAPVIVAMGPAIICVGLSAVPIAMLRRGMRFRALALQSLVAALLAQVVAIGLALAGAGVWALVAQLFVGQLITLVAAWVASRWRPALAFEWRIFRTMTVFGSNVVGVNAIALGRTWGENAIITNTLGVAPLGQLSIAQRLVQTSQDVAGAAISSVSTVVFAQVRDDPARLRNGYARALGMAYVLITPVLVAMAVVAPALVPLLFGAQWTPSIGATQALSIAAIFTLGAVLDHGLFYGLGRPGAWLIYALVVDVVTVATTAVVAQWGITAIGVGFLCVAAVATLARWVLVAWVLDSNLWLVSKNVLAALLSATISGGAGWLVFQSLASIPSLIAIAIASAVVLFVHLAVAWLILRRPLRELLSFVSSRISRRRRSHG